MSEYTRFTVRGYHLDHYGHMNINAYNTFMEEARWRLFENYNAIEFFSKLELALTLVNSIVDYRRPCMLGDILEVQTKVMKIGTSSCKVHQTIFTDGGDKKIAEAEHTFVLMDKSTLKAAGIEGKAREKLEQIAQVF